MASPDPNSTAYHIGQVIGALMVIGFPLIFGYFIYQYTSHKQKKHLVMAVLTGIPTLAICALFVFGMITGISQKMKERESRAPMTAAQLQEMKKGSWDEVAGKKFKYIIKLPGKANWTIKPTVGDFDLITTYRELYVGIIPELLDVNLDNYAKLIKDNAKEKFPDAEFSDEKELKIDEKLWKSYDMKLTVKGMKVHYRNYLCADGGKAVQILSWSAESQFDSCSDIIDQIAQSFRFNDF